MAEALDIVRASRLETTLSDGVTRHTFPHAGTSISHVPDEVWKRERLISRRPEGLVWAEECIKGVKQGKHRAVKSIVKRFGSQSIDFKHEVQALSLFSQPQYLEYFVEFYGWFEDDEAVYIAMELFRLGDLSRFMSRPFSDGEACHVLSQVVRGMAFMHSRNFSHRDLKPQNILVKQSRPRWSVRIADFGISKRITDTTFLRTETGTRHYMAPEIMGIFTLEDLKKDPPKDGRYSLVVDVWSVGVLAFHLLTNSLPFPDVRALSSFVTLGVTTPTASLLSFNLSLSCADFIRSCLAPSPVSRPTASELEAHAWLSIASDVDFGTTPVAQSIATPTNSGQGFHVFDITDPSGDWETVRPTVRATEPSQPARFSPGATTTATVTTKSTNETQTLITTIGDEEFDFDDVIVNSAAYRKAFAKQMKRIGNNDAVKSQGAKQKRSFTNLFARLLPRRRRLMESIDDELLIPSRELREQKDSKAEEIAVRPNLGSRIARMSALDPPSLSGPAPTEDDALVDPKIPTPKISPTVATKSKDVADASERLLFFKDYYSQDDILPGVKVSVLWAYQPRAPDEFALERGDMLRIAAMWDDGWATGAMVEDERADEWETRKDTGADENEGLPLPITGTIKAFPLVCVTLPQHWRKTIEGPQDVTK